MLPSSKRPLPKREEDEDDLMVLQERFLKENQVASAQVIRSQQKETSAKDDVHFDQKTATHDTQDDNSKDNEDLMHDVPTMNLDIIERDVRSIKFVDPPRESSTKRVPFPEAVHRSVMSHPDAKKIDVNKSNNERFPSKKTSIFMQQFNQNTPKIIERQPKRESIIQGSGLGSSGLKEAKAIHEENINRIKGMTQKEINDARRELLQQMNPQHVQFLLKQRVKGSTSTDAPKQQAVVTVAPDEEDLSYLPVTPSEAADNKWLNMDKIEKDKLEWIKPVDEKGYVDLMSCC